VSQSLVYQTPATYETIMRLLYGRHWNARHRAVADLIPEGASVLELCCGPGTLFRRELRRRGASYAGLDINPRFVGAVRAAGGSAEVRDVAAGAKLPLADVVLMQASLYHFLPDPHPIVDRMLAAARRRVIISEPVRNLSCSRVPGLGRLARSRTDPGDGGGTRRFDERALDALMADYRDRVQHSALLPGGREKVYVLEAQR
jgi:SAM-dependent methyltransferase